MRRISRETSGAEAHNEPHAYLEFICGARHFLGISENGPPLDQPAFNRKRLKAEKLIDSKVLEQLIRVQADAGCSRKSKKGEIKLRSGNAPRLRDDKT